MGSLFENIGRVLVAACGVWALLHILSVILTIFPGS